MIVSKIHDFARELFSINRIIIGKGVRETLKIISNHLPNLEIKFVPSQIKVFNWYVPKEWDVNEAYIISPSGQKIFDFHIIIFTFFLILLPSKGM